MSANALKASTAAGKRDSLRPLRTIHLRLNRGMPDGAVIRLRVWWPLLLLPIALVNQILAPHAVWVILVISLIGLYGVGMLWVRAQAPHVSALRQQTGSIMVAGDRLREDFELRNNSRLPVLWAEFIDESDVPGHSPGRVVACGAFSFYRWHNEVACERRGVFRLGPHRIRLGDPFGLFGIDITTDETDVLLIYPRVIHLPDFELPHGNMGESHRRRRPLRGPLPSASVTDYRPGDSLRHIHWRSSARFSRLMVKELEIEPSGDVWIVLDLNRRAQAGLDSDSTLEYSVIVAASIAAKLLAAGDRRSVGLLTISGDDADAERAVMAPPQSGQAQLWRILSALAPVEATDLTLADMLHNSRDVLGSRRTLIVITAQADIEPDSAVVQHRAMVVDSVSEVSAADASQAPPEALERRDWLSELVHLRVSGLDSTVLLIGSESGNAHAESFDALRGILAAEDIGSQVLYADMPMEPALTFRRTRRVVRSTPTGGVVSYDVVEDVG